MHYLLRYSEIGLKSRKVRKEFENFLIRDIKNACRYYGTGIDIKYLDGRIVVEGEKYIENILKEIGGIRSFSPVVITSASMDEIKRVALLYSSFIKENESFALRVRRTGNHDFTSRDVANVIGDEIRRKRKARVNLTSPQHEIYIEIRNKNAFIFREIIEGMGGLPYESQGKIMAYVEGEDDIKAAWLMMRRGCHVDFAITGNMENKIKKMMKWRKFEIYRCRNLQEAEKIAMEKECKAIVVGSKDFAKLCLPVFYPLLGGEYISSFKNNL